MGGVLREGEKNPNIVSCRSFFRTYGRKEAMTNVIPVALVFWAVTGGANRNPHTLCMPPTKVEDANAVCSLPTQTEWWKPLPPFVVSDSLLVSC